MASVELSDDGESATVNGRQVARAGVGPQVWSQIQAAAGAGGRSATQQASRIASQLGPAATPATPALPGAGVSQAAGSGARAARRAAGPAAPVAPVAFDMEVDAGIAPPVAEQAPADDQAALMARIQAAGQPRPMVGSPGTGPSMRRVQTTNTSTTGIEGAEDLRERGSDLAQQQRELAIDQAQHRIEQSDVRAEALATEAVATERATAEVTALRQEGQAEAEKFMQGARERRQQASELEAKGHDFWGDRNAGMKATALIGAVFSGMQAGLLGKTGNSMLEQIDGMIAREDRLHQQKIDGLREDARGQIDFYDIARTQTDDAVSQRLMAHNMMLESVKKKMEASLEGLGAGQASVDMQADVAQIDAKQLENDQALADRKQTTTAEKMVRVPGRAATGDYATGGQMGEGPAAAGQMAFRGAEVVDPGVWNTLKDADKRTARERVGAYNNLISQAERLMALREKHGTEFKGSEAEAEVVALMEGMAGNASKARGQGVLTGEEKPAFMKTIGGGISPKSSDIWRAFGRDETMNAIKGSLRTYKEEANQLSQGYGLKVAGTEGPKTRVRGAESGFK